MLSAPSSTARQRGVHLIELLVVLAIAGILFAAAAPNFSQMMANSRVRTAASGIISGLQLARNEALRRNTTTRFTIDSGGGWVVRIVSPDTIVQSVGAGESSRMLSLVLLNSQTALEFTPLGAVKNYDPLKNLTRIQLSPPRSSGATVRLQVDVLAGGQIRLCEPDLGIANDPRRCD